MKKMLFFFLLVVLSLGLTQAGFRPPEPEAETLVTELLEALGDVPLPHRPDLDVPGVSVERGRALVTEGVAGGPGGKISRHFVCTACHNVKRDEPNLRFNDPQKRLNYVAEKGLPFLPGSALYGVVNRTKFYNGDYEKKYGDLVKPARNDLREAIQLCAVECSQGRPLNSAEMESVLAYLWTIGLTIDDLALDEEELQTIRKALAGEGSATAAIRLLKSHYAAGAPATFIKPPENRRAGNPVAEKDPSNGKLIYELSCLHCHENQRYAFFRLDKTSFSYRYLNKHIPRYTRYSLYQVVRWGTSPIPGKHSYMPNYTLEKLSREMIEDLRAYIEQQGGRNPPETDPSAAAIGKL